MKMNRFKFVGISNLILTFSIVVLVGCKSIDVDQINSQLVSNPPAAGENKASNRMDGSCTPNSKNSAEFKRSINTKVVYKVTKGNLTSYSDLPSRSLIPIPDNTEPCLTSTGNTGEPNSEMTTVKAIKIRNENVLSNSNTPTYSSLMTASSESHKPHFSRATNVTELKKTANENKQYKAMGGGSSGSSGSASLDSALETDNKLNGSSSESTNTSTERQSTTDTTKILKVAEGNIPSYSDVPTYKPGPSKEDEEIIEVKTPAPSIDTNDTEEQIKHSQWESQFAMLPQDKNGWSIIKPAVDSRMIYVSSSDGNDSKAQAYFSKDIADPRNPPANIVAFKTIGEALKLQRDGYPDWILLKKGDTFHSERYISLPSGKSATAPLVMTSYGSALQRPIIKTGMNSGIVLIHGSNFIAVIGLDFYANQRDPKSTDFVGWSMVEASAPVGFMSVTADTKEVESLTLEDNVFRYFTINLQFNGRAKHNDIVVRRNQLLNSYSTTGHSQGIYASYSSILLEENLFDHNGWYQQNYEMLNSKSKGQATFFNHNAYLSGMFDTVVVGNIFSHASSMGIKLTANGDAINKINTIVSKNIIIDNNLIIEGEVGISAGGNTDFDNGYRWKNIIITNNVLFDIGKSQPTRRKLGLHISANDWDGGLIEGNYLLCNNNPSVKNISGIVVLGMSRDISVKNNTIYGLDGDKNKMIYKDSKETQTGIDFNNNYIDTNGSCADFEYSSDVLVNNIIEGAKAQSLNNWKLEYTASSLNAKIKASPTLP